MAQNEIRKDGAHHHKIARISILENDILFERYGRFLSLSQIVQLCLKVPYLVQDIYFTRQKWSLLFYFVLKGVLALFIYWVAEMVEGVDQTMLMWGLSLSLNSIMLCFTSFFGSQTQSWTSSPKAVVVHSIPHQVWFWNVCYVFMKKCVSDYLKKIFILLYENRYI